MTSLGGAARPKRPTCTTWTRPETPTPLPLPTPATFDPTSALAASSLQARADAFTPAFQTSVLKEREVDGFNRPSLGSVRSDLNRHTRFG